MQPRKYLNMQSDMHVNKQYEKSFACVENVMSPELHVNKFGRTYPAYKRKLKEPQTVQTEEDNVSVAGNSEDTKSLRLITPSDVDLSDSSKKVKNESRPLVIFENQSELSPTSRTTSNSSGRECINDSMTHRSDTMQEYHLCGRLYCGSQGETENVLFDSISDNSKNKLCVAVRKEKNQRPVTQRCIRKNVSQSNGKDSRICCLNERPGHHVLGFMEDLTEFCSEREESSKCQGHSESSVLESTVDGSIIELGRTYQPCLEKSEGMDTCQNRLKNVSARQKFKGIRNSRTCTPSEIDLPTLSKEMKGRTSPFYIQDSRTKFFPISWAVSDTEMILQNVRKLFPSSSKAVLESYGKECNEESLVYEEYDYQESHTHIKETDAHREKLLDSITPNIRTGVCILRKKENDKILVRERSKRMDKSLKNCEKEVRIFDQNKRPQHCVLGFMEDHAEFGSEWEEASKCQGRYISSILESTVDGSIIKGARRVIGQRRLTPEELKSCIDSAIEKGDMDEDPLKILDDWGLKSEYHKYKCSSCEESSYRRRDIDCHISSSKDAKHSDSVVVVLLGSKAQGKTCSLCNVKLHRTEYFKHMRENHKEVFPLGCGYCTFLGQDYNQLQHHIQKKHKTDKFEIINTLKKQNGNHLPFSGSDAFSDEEKEAEEVLMPMQSFVCPICKKKLKTLRTLKKHVTQHSRQKRQCALCPFTTTFPTKIRSHYHSRHPHKTPRWEEVCVTKSGSDTLVMDVTPYLKLISSKYGIKKPKENKWKRQYKCPHCDYTCNFNSSYNRHLNIHKGNKPFKCGYCDYHARESYVVNKHCLKAHEGKPFKVEKDKNFKAPYRYAKKMKKETISLDDPPEHVTRRDNPYTTESPLAVPPIQVKSEGQVELREDLSMHRSDHKSKPRKMKDKNDSDLGREGNDLLRTADASLQECLVSISEKEQMNFLSPQEGKSENNEKKDMITRKFRKHEENSPNKEIGKGIQKSANMLSKFCENDSFLVNSMQNRPNETEYKPYKISTEDNIHKQQDKLLASLPWCERPRYVIKVKTFFSNNYVKRFSKLKPNICVANCNNYCDMQCSLVETNVINIYANESDALNTVTNRNSVEISAFKEVEYDIKKPDPNLQNYEDCSQQTDIIVENLNLSQISLKENNLHESGNSELLTLAKGHNDKDIKFIFKFKDPSDVPRTSQGLEETLRSHITFLSNSLTKSKSGYTAELTSKDLKKTGDKNDYFSSERVRKMMKKTGSGSRVKCQECGVSTTYRAFYKHAKKHFNVKPFKCGYCTYRSIEKSKIRVHNAFCHPEKPCVIMKLSPENASVDASCSKSLHDTVAVRHEYGGNEIEHNIATSPLKSVSVTKSENVMKNPTKVNKCKVSSGKPATQLSHFHCSICSKVLKNHTPSIRRHLFSHYNYKPYKCGYCDFTAVVQSEIRSHHVKHGSVTPPKIIQSDVPMPLELTNHMKTFLGQQRINRRSQKKKDINNQLSFDLDKNSTDILWHEPATPKEDLTAMYLNASEPSQQGLVTDDHHELQKALGVESCSLQHTLESVVFNAEETKYSVQALENEGQSSRFPVIYLPN